MKKLIIVLISCLLFLNNSMTFYANETDVAQEEIIQENVEIEDIENTDLEQEIDDEIEKPLDSQSKMEEEEKVSSNEMVDDVSNEIINDVDVYNQEEDNLEINEEPLLTTSLPKSTINEEFVASADKNGNISITSTNSDLLSYLAYDANAYITIDDSSFSVCLYAKPYEVDKDNTHYEVLFSGDFPQSILIRKEVLYAYNFSGQLEIYVSKGLDDYRSTITVTGAKDAPADITISENNGRFEINSSDKNYLRSLCKFSDFSYDYMTGERNEELGSAVILSEVDRNIYSYDSMRYDSRNSLSNLYSNNKNEELFYDTSKQVVYVPKEILDGEEVLNKNDFDFLLLAYGYKPLYKTANITIGSDILGDCAFTIAQDTNGDIVVTSNKEELIDSLIQERVYTGYPDYTTIKKEVLL